MYSQIHVFYTCNTYKKAKTCITCVAQLAMLCKCLTQSCSTLVVMATTCVASSDHHLTVGKVNMQLIGCFKPSTEIDMFLHKIL